MKNMKTGILTILMAAILAITSTAMAQNSMEPQNRKDGKEMMRKGMKQDAQKPDFLTMEQKETLKKLRMETAKEIKPLKNELRETMAHQQTLITADKADLAAINKNIDKMWGIKAEMAKIMAKQHQAFRSQLTEEQLIQFDSRKNRMDREMRNSDQRKRPGREGKSM